MPNKLHCTRRGDYCECVRHAQLHVLTEVRAPSLLEQRPRYVPPQDRAGYNRVSSHVYMYLEINTFEGF